MKTTKTLSTLLGALALLAASSALAGPSPFSTNKRVSSKDGRWSRPAVVKYYKQRNLSTDIRVHQVRKSGSGLSSQVAVNTRESGEVRLFNVSHRGRKVSATPTGLVKQSTARGTAHQLARRERAPLAGTYAGVHRSGLSVSGKSYKFSSKTDGNERVYVNTVSGKALRFDPRRGKPASKPTLTFQPPVALP